MYIIQKSFTGGNGKSRYDSLFENEIPVESNVTTPVKTKDPYAEKDEYLSSKDVIENGEEISVEEPKIKLKPGQKDPTRVDLAPAGISKAKTKVRIPKKLETPVVENNPEVEITTDETESSLSNATKAGLIGAGVAAVGAGSYAAYKAWKKRKAKKAAVDAEVKSFLNNNYKTN